MKKLYWLALLAGAAFAQLPAPGSGIGGPGGGGGSGDVVGPASALDNEVAIFDSTTGKLLKRGTGCTINTTTAIMTCTGGFSSGDGTKTSKIDFAELAANGSNLTSIYGPDALSADSCYTLPTAVGTSGQVLGDAGTTTTTTETVPRTCRQLIWSSAPTISSFANAAHTHADAAGGGQLSATTAFGSGTVPTARLGSGTANSTTFLRGDQTYAAAGSSVPAASCFAATNCALPDGDYAGAALVAVANRVYVQQIYIPPGSTFTKLRVHSSGGATTSAKAGGFGIYADSSNAPGSKLEGVAVIGMDAAGILSGNVALTGANVGGNVWLAWSAEETGILAKLIGGSQPQAMMNNVSPTKVGYCANAATGTGTGFALPATCGAITGAAVNAPLVYLAQ